MVAKLLRRARFSWALRPCWVCDRPTALAMGFKSSGMHKKAGWGGWSISLVTYKLWKRPGESTTATTTRNGVFLFSSFARSLSCRLFFSSPQPSFSSPPFFFFLLSFFPLPPSFPLKYSLVPPKYSLLTPLSLLMHVTARNARALFYLFVAPQLRLLYQRQTYPLDCVSSRHQNENGCCKQPRPKPTVVVVEAFGQLNFVTASGRGACERLRYHTVELPREPHACPRAGSPVWAGCCRAVTLELIGALEYTGTKASRTLCSRGLSRRVHPHTTAQARRGATTRSSNDSAAPCELTTVTFDRTA